MDNEDNEGSSSEATVGIAIAIVGSIFGNFGVNFQKYSFMNEAEKPSNQRRAYAKQPRWWFGMFMVILGALANFASFALAPQSVIAPIGALVLVWNLMFAHFWLGETLRCRDISGTALIVGSVVLIVAFGSRQSKDLTLGEVRARYAAPEVWAYFAGAGAISFIYYSLQFKASNILVYEAKKRMCVSRKKQAKKAKKKGMAQRGSFGAKSLTYAEWEHMDHPYSHPTGEGLNGIDNGNSYADTPLTSMSNGDRCGSDLELQPVTNGYKSKNDAVLEGQESESENSQGSGPHLLKGKIQVHVARDGVPDFSALNDMGHRRAFAVYNNVRKYLCCCLRNVPSFSRMAYDVQSFVGLFRTEASDEEEITLTDERVTSLIHSPPEKYRSYSKLHPLSLAGLAGVIGAQNTLFAKTVGEMLKSSIDGDNQMGQPVLYAFVASLFTSIIVQQHFLAKSLEIFDALYVVPVFQAHFILTGIISGGINFQEFSDFGFINFVMFPIGVIILIGGIVFLSQRRMREATSRKADVDREYKFCHHVFHTDYQGSLNVLPMVAPIDSRPSASSRFVFSTGSSSYEAGAIVRSASNRHLSVPDTSESPSELRTCKRRYSDSFIYREGKKTDMPHPEFLDSLIEQYYRKRRERLAREARAGGAVLSERPGIPALHENVEAMRNFHRNFRHSGQTAAFRSRNNTSVVSGRDLGLSSAQRPPERSERRARASTGQARRSWLWPYNKHLPTTLLLGIHSNDWDEMNRNETQASQEETDASAIRISIEPVNIPEEDQDDAEGSFWESLGAGLSFLNTSDYAAAGTRASGLTGLSQYRRMREEQIRQAANQERQRRATLFPG
eukprot:gb/GECG01011266.1/.p1 GENE.gb/GECG01011266.1/~~gb/GECG01011266.1/.p1  ORF type:complete len:842 (+),score=103.15 gb/GECG01011266.1/:1-2526(+)